MKLVLVSGPPATGKTAIGKEIAHRLGYRFYSKDQIKEILFESQTRTTHDYFWYEKRAKSKFFKEIERYVATNKSLVAENNYMPSDNKRLGRLTDENIEIIEIYCKAKGMTFLRRYIARNEDGTRHRGHHDRRWYPTVFIESLLSYVGIMWPYGPTKVADSRMIVDTTHFSKIDYQKIVDFIGRD